MISYSGSSGEKEKLGLLVTPKRVQGRPLDYREGHSAASSPPTSLCIARVSAISMFWVFVFVCPFVLKQAGAACMP